MAGPGNGPVCPVDPTHGRMYSIDRGGDASKGFRCMHTAHGGNGRKFTDKEVAGYELTEDDVTSVYTSYAHGVVEGESTLDQAVQALAKHTKQPTSQVREALNIAIDTIKEKDTDMAEKKKAAAAKAATKPAKQAGDRRRLEHADGAQFKAVLDEYGLNNKQAAEATSAAGMGASPTYIYILTHQGSSVKLLERFQDAIKVYVRENKIRRVTAKAAKAAVEPSAEAEVEPEVEPEVDETAVETAAAELEPEPVEA